MQRYTVFFIALNVLHFSGGFSAHHQELLFLHQTGSNNPLGLNKNADKIPFHPCFTVKDILGFACLLLPLAVAASKLNIYQMLCVQFELLMIGGKPA